MDNKLTNQEEQTMKQLTPEQKRTILEWVKYLGKTLLKAIAQKMFNIQTSSALVLICLAFGCVTSPEICVTKSWEGHFFNTNDFQKATCNICLEKKESIWVLSDKSLLKIIENAQKGK